MRSAVAPPFGPVMTSFATATPLSFTQAGFMNCSDHRNRFSSRSPEILAVMVPAGLPPSVTYPSVTSSRYWPAAGVPVTFDSGAPRS